MTTYDSPLEKWRASLAEGTHESCMDSAALRPGSFCVVFDMCWGGPMCGMVSMLAPEYFDTPADFVAHVRVVELPRSLEMLCRTVPDGEGFPSAEEYLPLVGEADRALAQAAIAAADAVLAKAAKAPGDEAPAAGTTHADAAAVIAAFNAVFGHYGTRYIASGDVTCLFSVGRITDNFDAWSDHADDMVGSGEPDMVVKPLLDAGAFDPEDPSHVDLVRDMLQYFPLC